MGLWATSGERGRLIRRYTKIVAVAIMLYGTPGSNIPLFSACSAFLGHCPIPRKRKMA